MNTKYKASVVVYVHNADKTLIRCAESVVLGKYEDLEVIFVDDCSTDQSWDLCRKLSELYPNVFCWKNSSYKGTSYSKDLGIQNSKGRYIFFINAHDWISADYLELMMHTSIEYPNSLVLSGYYHLEEGRKEAVVLKNSGCDVFLCEKEQYFELLKLSLLHQSWNKVFSRDVIVKNNISFRESESIDEDFLFILDYIEALEDDRIVVQNKALYYYNDRCKNSWLREYELNGIDDAYELLIRLNKLSGLDDYEECNDYFKMICSQYIRQIVKTKSYTKEQIISNIKTIPLINDAEKEYQLAKKQIIREKKSQLKQSLIGNAQRVKRKIQREFRYAKIKKIRTGDFGDVTIISQNCIGGVVYHDMGKEFLSPTINLFFYAHDFVKFVQNLDYYLGLQINWRWKEEYPVGILGDIEIHFMHYDNSIEAQNAWNRRSKRIKKNRILVLSTDREGFDRQLFEEWKKIKYPKLLFTAQKELSIDNDSLFFPEYTEQGYVGDLIPNRLFYRDNKLIDRLKVFKG